MESDSQEPSAKEPHSQSSAELQSGGDKSSNSKDLCDNADVNSNTVPGSDGTGDEKQEDKRDAESMTHIEWRKMSGGIRKRTYRTHDSETGKGFENIGTNDADSEEDMAVDGKGDERVNNAEKDLQAEELVEEENCKISERDTAESVKSNGGKLKRAKCKQQQPFAERKKRKKTLSGKKGECEGVINSDNDPGTSQTVDNTMEINNDNGNGELELNERDTADTGHDTRTSSSSSSSSSESSGDEKENKTETVLTDDEVWLKKHTDPITLPDWRAVEQMWKRECGCSNRHWMLKVCGSNAMVRRFEQQFTLDAHEGCVNALHFNQTGTLLASGSDDLDIHIWDWSSQSQNPFISYNSGHRSNVFQAKFMPNSNDLTVISCARDGQVRIGYLSSTGTCRDTKKIAQHRGSAHKLALDSAGCRSTFLSCGEDSVVMGFDLRENKPGKRLVSVKEGNSKIALYSIDTSPHQPFEFAVSGRDQWARVYDRRMLDSIAPETVARYCPHHLQNATDLKANITCLVYNYDGSEVLCSYNDEDIYLFNAKHSSGDEFTRKYKGHRNNATVKGVNFYGPRSEFIVSGSDCGNIFLWDKASSKVVQFMQGDDGGVVNVLEPHPNLPVLATSGLDKNIKIWGPSGDGMLDEEKLKKLMLSNRKERHDESNESHVIDSHLLWFLMRSLRNARGRRRQRREGEDDNDEDNDSSNTTSSNSSSDSDRDEESESRRRMDCLTS